MAGERAELLLYPQSSGRVPELIMTFSDVQDSSPATLVAFQAVGAGWGSSLRLPWIEDIYVTAKKKRLWI